MENQPHYHILLAEDNAFNQKVTMTMLKRMGLTVDVAANGQEVLDKLLETTYQLILMDCEMPVMDGYKATGKIRQNETATGKHVPIIAMTGHSSPEDRQYCLQSGMDDYISKPFKYEALQDILARWQVK